MNWTKHMLLMATTITAGALCSCTEGEERTRKADEPFIGRNNIEIPHRTLTPEALWAMGRIGGADIAPDAKSIAYNVAYYSVEHNKSHNVIYTIGTDGTGEQLLTSAPTSEIAPKYIDGGKHIAYLAADADGKMQLWKMNPDGTERQQISFLDKDVEDYAFSPDGKMVLIIHAVKYGQRASDMHPDLTKTTGRVLNDAMYRHWDEWVEAIPQPFIYTYNNGKVCSENPVNILGNEPYECPMKPFGGIEQLAWSPCSGQIAYTCRKKTGLDYAVSTDSDIYLYNISSGVTINLCKPADYQAPTVDYSRSLQHQAVNKQAEDYNVGYDTNPQFSPDGRYIAWQSMERDGYESDRNRLCVYELVSGRKFYITEQFESNVDAFAWDSDNQTLYFVGTWHGTTHVYATNLNGEVRRITDGQYDYTSVAICGDKLLCGRQSMRESLELYLVDPTEATVEQVTRENQYFRDAIDWGTVESRTIKAVDGKDLQYWVILPPNFDPNKKYPTLLFCEGGPQSPVSQFWSYRWNFMMMAANDYVIIAPNRRGLPGFGMEWLEEISTNYTGRCMDDYKSAIDDAVKNLPYVDKEHLGCIGASFGGYSVYWLAGNHDKRFKCFIAHDGIFNLEQQYLETEEMWFANWDLGGAPWHKDAHIQRTYQNSPHKFVDRWDTPILCIQGEKDYRIVTSQAMSAYNAALYRGIPAEFLVFPDENHWVLRPQNGILWQRTFFGWLDKWLK